MRLGVWVCALLTGCVQVIDAAAVANSGEVSEPTVMETSGVGESTAASEPDSVTNGGAGAGASAGSGGGGGSSATQAIGVGDGAEAGTSDETNGTQTTDPTDGADVTDTGLDDGDTAVSGGEIPVLEWVSVIGTVEAGPFTAGSSLEFSALDSLGYPYGLTVETVVIDDTGAFGPVDLPAGVVLVTAQGRYYDLAQDAISDAPLTLEMVAITDGKPIHVNVIGHIAAPRILQRLHDGLWSPFYVGEQAAVNSALGGGAYWKCGGIDLTEPPATLSLQGPDDNPNAFLLAATAALQWSTLQEMPDDPTLALQQRIDAIAAGDASFSVRTALAESPGFDPVAMRSNVHKYYQALGVATEPGDLSRLTDEDGEGCADLSDNCPTIVNEEQGDGDEDGIGVLCDCDMSSPDPDGDGWPSDCDTCDDVANAPYSDGLPGNWENQNWDGDEWGNACDSCPRSWGVGGVPGENCCDPRSYYCHKTVWSSMEMFRCVLASNGSQFRCTTNIDFSCGYGHAHHEACQSDTPPWLPPGAFPVTEVCGEDESCTSQWCTVGDDGPCTNALVMGATCIPWLEVADAPPGLEDLGVCALADVGPCAGGVGRDCAYWYGQ